MEDKKVIEALQTISDYCAERECYSCFLYETNFCGDAFRGLPGCWDIPKEEEDNEKG